MHEQQRYSPLNSALLMHEVNIKDTKALYLDLGFELRDLIKQSQQVLWEVPISRQAISITGHSQNRRIDCLFYLLVEESKSRATEISWVCLSLVRGGQWILRHTSFNFRSTALQSHCLHALLNLFTSVKGAPRSHPEPSSSSGNSAMSNFLCNVSIFSWGTLIW